MYCPRCAQQQLSPEVRFCSRCGFELRAVSHLLATGGLVPTAEDPSGEQLTPRQKGIRFGAKVLFASLVSLPLLIGFSILVDHPASMMVFVTLFLIGVFRMLYARLFESNQRPFVAAPPALGAPARENALPPYQPPASVVRPAGTTGELSEPPSVTERTTHLFDK
jgi:hypothetical protein